jgi:plasmid stabilization system protein ParE
VTAAYRLTPDAREGFLRIAFYVEECFGPGVADRVVEELESAFEQLASNPGIGHHRADLTRDKRVRFWSVGPTLIAYRVQPECLEVLFVERGDLDWERMLTKLVSPRERDV